MNPKWIYRGRSRQEESWIVEWMTIRSGWMVLLECSDSPFNSSCHRQQQQHQESPWYGDREWKGIPSHRHHNSDLMLTFSGWNQWQEGFRWTGERRAPGWHDECSSRHSLSATGVFRCNHLTFSATLPLEEENEWMWIRESMNENLSHRTRQPKKEWRNDHRMEWMNE